MDGENENGKPVTNNMLSELVNANVGQEILRVPRGGQKL